MTARTADLPDWLRPIADLAGSVRAEQLAPRFPHPPPDARPAAVLMLFADGPRGPMILLTERAQTLRNHAGQISFPGGKSDPEDADATATALREAEEEIGLDPASVEVFGSLPTLWIPPSNHAVTPILGYWREWSPELRPVSLDEVDEVIWTPIKELLDPERRFSVVHSAGWRGPAFDIGTVVPLWGFTAGVIARLFDHVGWARPWDSSRERPLPEL